MHGQQTVANEGDMEFLHFRAILSQCHVTEDLVAWFLEALHNTAFYSFKTIQYAT